MATLLIHGGAGAIALADRAAYLAGLKEARDAAFSALEAGEAALEVALVAVRTMEDNPGAFNAGTGGSLNAEGVLECDAAVMNGADGSAGAVAAVTRAKNPIVLADNVRRESPHVLLVGPAADAFEPRPIDNSVLITPLAKAKLERWRQKQQNPSSSATVGAVVCDHQGCLAAATSTGGMLGKWAGRVGDSPLIGAGTYANDQLALSCTGVGEAFIRAVTAKAVAERVRAGGKLHTVVEGALAELGAFGGEGGLICVTRDETVVIGFNTPTMAYAWKRGGLTPSEGAEVGTQPGVSVM